MIALLKNNRPAVVWLLCLFVIVGILFSLTGLHKAGYCLFDPRQGDFSEPDFLSDGLLSDQEKILIAVREAIYSYRHSVRAKDPTSNIFDSYETVSPYKDIQEYQAFNPRDYVAQHPNCCAIVLRDFALGDNAPAVPPTLWNRLWGNTYDLVQVNLPVKYIGRTGDHHEIPVRHVSLIDLCGLVKKQGTFVPSVLKPYGEAK